MVYTTLPGRLARPSLGWSDGPHSSPAVDECVLFDYRGFVSPDRHGGPRPQDAQEVTVLASGLASGPRLDAARARLFEHPKYTRWLLWVTLTGLFSTSF